MNISFCGSGFTGIYHLGVINCFRKHGREFLKSINKVAGVSSGSQIGTVLVIDPEKTDECVKFTHDLAAEIRSKKYGQMTRGYDLYVTLRQFFEHMLPRDAYSVATDRMYISLTNMTTKKNELVHNYSSNEELIQCILASSYIPGYSKSPPIIIRGQKYKDGGFTDNLPVFPEGRTILVSPFYGKQDITPNKGQSTGYYIRHANQSFSLDRRNLRAGIHALFPPTKEILHKYYEAGLRDAGDFLKQEGLFE